MKIIPVILSDVSGTHLWPLPRKQYLPLVGDSTMLQKTILQLNGLDDLEEGLTNAYSCYMQSVLSDRS